MRGHSDLSPSSAKRWINCPGSVSLCATLPPSQATEYSAEGTVAHSLGEELLTGRTDSLDLLDRINTEVQQDGFTIPITEEMVDAAIEYSDVVKKDMRELDAIKRPAAVVSKTEMRVCATSVDGDLWGTSDHITYRPGHKLIVYDFKYGKGVVVDPKENEQMAIYAVAVMDTEAGWAYDEVELVIVQPRAGHVDGRIRRWATTTKWLAEFRDNLRKAVKATQISGAELVSGDWCRWCPAKASCPALAKEVQRQVGVDFAVALPQHIPAALPSPALMPIELLAKALAWEDAINGWYEALKLRAKEELEAGRIVPGFKLVDGKSNRKWVSEEAVIRRFASILGEDKLFEKKLLSPAKLEKIVGKGKLEEEGLTFKPEVGKSIAPDNDPRPPARSSAADDFRPAREIVAELTAEIVGPEKVTEFIDPLEDPINEPKADIKELWPV